MSSPQHELKVTTDLIAQMKELASTIDTFNLSLTLQWNRRGTRSEESANCKKQLSAEGLPKEPTV